MRQPKLNQIESPSSRIACALRMLVILVSCFSIFLSHDLAVGQIRNEIAIKSALVKPIDVIEVPAEQTGVLTQLLIREGNYVRIGDTVGAVDDQRLQQQLKKARLDHELAKMEANDYSDLEYARKSYELAESDLRRSTEANQRVANSVTDSRVEKQKLEVQRTTLMFQQSKHKLELAAFKTRLTSAAIEAVQLEISKTKIKSSCQGLVVSLEKRQGEWVNSSDVICKVLPTDRVRVEGFINAVDVARVVPGQKAVVRFNYPWMAKKQFAGKVVFVSPEANPVNLQIRVWVEVDGSDLRIPSGTQAEVVVQAISSDHESLVDES